MKKIRAKIKECRTKRYRKYLEAFVKNMFQVRESGGEYWLTIRGEAMIPESLLKEGIIETLEKIRPLFVERILREKFDADE